MELNKIPILKVIVNDDETGIDQISFVEDPAMMEQWKLFSKQTKHNFRMIKKE